MSQLLEQPARERPAGHDRRRRGRRPGPAARRSGEGEVPALAAGLHVEIAIQDTGHGIPPEVLPRVFDPFFTTRETGTGLGLATSYSIARRHGGHIGIASRVGEGTTVTLLLPAATGIPEADVPGARRPRRSRRRGGCACCSWTTSRWSSGSA